MGSWTGRRCRRRQRSPMRGADMRSRKGTGKSDSANLGRDPEARPGGTARQFLRPGRPFSAGGADDESAAAGKRTRGGDPGVVRASGAARSGQRGGRGGTGRAGSDTAGRPERSTAVVLCPKTLVVPFAVGRAEP